MSIVETAITILVDGTVVGSIIGLAGIGLTLAYGVTKFINFSYGELLTYGAYVALGLTILGVPLPLAILLSLIAVAGIAVVTARIFFKPIRNRGPIPLLITSMGVSFVLRYILRIAAGPGTRKLPIPLMPPFEIAGTTISPIGVLILVASAVLLAGIHGILQYTLMGKQMRAISGNLRLARISGINVDAVIRNTWILSGILGAIAGIFLAAYSPPFRFVVGWRFLPVLFTATILGGIGRPYGAIVASLIVGISMSFGTTVISSKYTLGYAFIILIVTLIIKPEGIAGRIS